MMFYLFLCGFAMLLFVAFRVRCPHCRQPAYKCVFSDGPLASVPEEKLVVYDEASEADAERFASADQWTSPKLTPKEHNDR